MFFFPQFFGLMVVLVPSALAVFSQNKITKVVVETMYCRLYFVNACDKLTKFHVFVVFLLVLDVALVVVLCCSCWWFWC